FGSPGAALAGVQVSVSMAILPSDSTLVVNEQLDLTVRLNNLSSNTPPPDSNPVGGTLTGTTTVKLACVDSVCTQELPGELMFIGCTGLDPGVASCEAIDSNTVLITMTAAGVSIPAAGFKDFATVVVKTVAPSDFGGFFVAAATGSNDFIACEQ